MGNSKQHYETLLADRYLWLMGGMEANVEHYEKLFHSLELTPRLSGNAVDLGAGAGFQSIPLARMGYKVIAIDQSLSLLDVMREETQELPVTLVCDDMLRCNQYCPQKLELAVCMGDTLPHLANREQVAQLLQIMARRLEQGGHAVLMFRDLNEPRTGLNRFIDVRSDDSRIFTCFLEYGPERVTVNDLIHERQNGQWVLHKGAYNKLRLDPKWVTRVMGKEGLRIRKTLDDKGMLTIVARKQ